MPDLDALHPQRLRNWRQTPDTRAAEPGDGADLINAVGVATLFPASAELPNLYHAHVGNPSREVEPEWGSDAGRVYTWRWELGRADAAFYCVLVRGRPSWVSWALLPSILRLRGELRMPDELYDLGALSDGAYRIVRALEDAGGVLSTGDLRQAANFPTGREHRAAYLKAVDELDKHLLLAKVFPTDIENMSHALVRIRYRTYADAADALSREEALHQLLLAYLPNAVYAIPAVLAKALKLPEAELRAGLDRLTERGVATHTQIEGIKGDCYFWRLAPEHTPRT